MTSCPFSENGMPIKGWPKSLLNSGACSICSAILAVYYLLCPGKYSIRGCHLPCKSPCSTSYEWLCCKNAGDLQHKPSEEHQIHTRFVHQGTRMSLRRANAAWRS